MELLCDGIKSMLQFMLISMPFLLVIWNIQFIAWKSEDRKYTKVEKISVLGMWCSILFSFGAVLGDSKIQTLHATEFLSSIKSVEWNILDNLMRDVLFVLSGDFHTFIHFAGNIIVFMPLGFFSACTHKGKNFLRLKVICICFLVSLTVEIIEVVCLRIVDVNDIILNTFGGYIGYGLFWYLRELFPNIFFTMNLTSRKNQWVVWIQCLLLLLALGMNLIGIVR